MVKLMRQYTKELTNFENLHEWKNKIDDETEERIILVRDSVTTKYYYYVFHYKIILRIVIFISSTPSETVAENEHGDFVLPAILKQTKPQVLPEVIPLPEEPQPQVLP